MSHVDDGTLHAYLDGALEEYPASEARRVRDHLEACASCRQRLAAERRIREEAASILGLTVPRVEPPTLEELRAYVRAEAAHRAPVGGRLRGLGWAASLVLALGAGWMLRGDQGAAPATPDAGGTVQEASPLERQRTPAAPPIEAAQAPTPAQEETPSISPPDAPAMVAIAIDAPPVDVMRDDTVLDPLPIEVAPPALPEPEAIVVAALGEPAVDRAVVAELEVASDPATPERRAATGEVMTSARVSAPTTGLVLGRAAADGQRDQAAGDDSYSLVVPGLPVLDVRFRGSGTEPEGQMALQRLESGDTLQVIHLPLELDPARLEAGEPGTRELVVRRSAGWIVMRAPLEDAALMELMTRLLAGR
jgi:hypothetical protein